MKDQNLNMPDRIIILFLSWFYSGKFPKAPGTIGSLATLPLIYLFAKYTANIFVPIRGTFVYICGIMYVCMHKIHMCNIIDKCVIPSLTVNQ